MIFFPDKWVGMNLISESGKDASVATAPNITSKSVCQ